MYLSSIRIRNIKCFDDAELTFPGEPGNHAGWHVLLGVNGTGKSTLLQAMALAMLGPVSGGRLLKRPASWVRDGSEYGEIKAGLTTTANDTTSAGAPRKKPYDAHLLMIGEAPEPVVVESVGYAEPQVTLYKSALGKSLSSGPYSNRRGWFSAGYGPFRRLTGSGGEEDASIHHGPGREARHHTLFSESAALTRCEKWLSSLHSQSNDPALPEREQIRYRLEVARKLINGLLPYGVRIDGVNSLGVTFATGSGVKVALSQLSDGYRSVLALAIDLLRHILDAGEYGSVTDMADGRAASIDTEGVVLIDEADAHLHPTWQRDIGFRMCAAFPNIQFIVSSHSPFVAQAAKEGGLFVVTSSRNGNVVIEPAGESVRGWRADQILLSPLFGLDSTRDPETERFLERRTTLLAKGVSLTRLERGEIKDLEQKLRARLTAPGDTYEEQEREREMQRFIDQRLATLNDGSKR